MSTFKLSKNQEFYFLKGRDRFLSLLYSFSPDIDAERLKDSCIKGIQSLELANFNLVDVSASFPLQSKGIAKIEIDEINDPEFTIEKFYQLSENDKTKINLYNEKPIKISFIKSEVIYLWLNASSIYFDAYSANMIIKRIADIYTSQISEFQEEIDYFSYSEWQNDILSEEPASENYYYLKSKEQALNLKNDFVHSGSFTGSKIQVEDILVCNKNNTIPDHLVAATLKLFSNYINVKHFSIGLIPYYRNHDILNETIGLINTPLPVFYSSEEYSDLEDIVTLLDETKINRDNFNYSILPEDFDNFQIIYFDVPNSESLTLVGARFEAFLPADENNGIKIIFIVSNQKIIVRAIFHDTLENKIPHLFIEQLRKYLCSFTSNGNLDLFASEYQIDFYLKNTWKSPAKLSEKNHNDVLTLLADCFEKYAEFDCLAYEDTCLTFSEVNSISNRMSRFLLSELGVSKGDRVALFLPRSINQIIALFGILKSGASFIAIDPALPDSRKRYIEEDADVKCCIDISVMEKFQVDKYENAPLILSMNPEDACYCIYTSGSTGLPKGCCISHRNMLNYLNWIGEYWKGNELRNVGYFTPLTFDFTITSIFGSVMSGSCLNIINEDTDLCEILNQIISDSKVGVVKITPAHIGLINKEALQNSTPKVFIVGGEALSKKQIEYLRHNKDCKVYNEYGPTEATVGCIVQLVDETNEPLIGKAIPGVNVIVVNEKNRPLPVGCVGEILLTGESVIKEYLSPSEQNTVKFTKVEGMEGLFYRTGDLGRLTGNGLYEYHGRKDDQVKLNGFRIELAEVEFNIKNIEYVSDAAVVVHIQNENRQLVAFWVSNHNEINFSAELKKFLPSYMIPSRYVKLDFLPLNKNGKVDKTLLSQMPLESENLIIPLDTKSESLIADAIAAELNIERQKIGKESNFISLGGDSIKAIQVLATLRKSQYQVSLQDLMGGKSIASLARNLKSIQKQANQNPVSGIVELSPIQSLFLGNNFISGTQTEKSFFNQSQLLELNQGLTNDDLHQILKKLIEHHDILRASFQLNADKSISQIVKDFNEIKSIPELIDFSIFQLDTKLNEIEKTCEMLKSQLNLQMGSLFKSALIKTHEKTFIFITAHHLVTDLVSWKILLEDLDTLITQKRSQRKLQLPLKTDSYQLWVNAMINKGIELKESQDKYFWDGVLSESVNDISMNKKGFLFYGSSTTVMSVSQETTAKINAITRNNIYLNTQSVILRSLGDGLAEVFGKGAYRIHLEGHGRNALSDIDHSRTIGWFTSIYPVVLSCKNERSKAEDYVELGYTLSNLPNDGLSYGILNHAGELKHQNVVSWIEFNYLGDLVNDTIKFSNFNQSEISHGFEASRKLMHMADFSIIAYHKKDKLFIEFNYNTESLDKRIMESLAQKTVDSIIFFTIEFEKNNQQFLLSRPATTKGIAYDVIKRLETELGESEDILVLSPLQSGIYFHALAEEDDRAYFWQYAYQINNSIDIGCFRLAFIELLKRHQVLRTVFRNDVIVKPVQIILKEPKVDFRFNDISDLMNDEQEIKIAEIRDADIKEGFDIANGPLIRLYLIKLRDNVFYRIWSNHHLLLDGWSTQLVLREFERLYFGLIDGKPANLPDLPSFSAYIDWYQQLNIITSQKYWKEYLLGYEYSLSLPGDLMKQSKKYIPKDYFFTIDNYITQRINEYAVSLGVTLNALVQCIWGLIIARQNQVNDVVFGSVVSGRSSEITDADKMVGMLINTIPNRIRFEEETSLNSLLEQFFRSYVEGEPYHYLPLFEIQKQSSVGKDLIQNVITYVNYPASENDVKQSFEIKRFSIDEDSIQVYETTQFDINILVYQGNGLEFNIKYNAATYSQEAIYVMSKIWDVLLKRISNQKEIIVGDLLSITEEEKSICLTRLGIGANKEIPFENLLEWLEISFLKDPHSTCIVDDTQEYTYSEFWFETDRFAHFLSDTYQLKDSDFVGICLTRSVEQLIALLGVIKTGSAYIPIDVSWPEDRITNVVESARMKVLINQETLIAFRNWVKVNQLSNTTLNKKISGDSAVYCIYTSGSTGLPKGCMISHKNLLNYLLHANTYWINSNTIETAYFSPLSFDFTITSIFGCWLNQGKLKIYSEDANIYDVINEVVANPLMKVIKMAPAHINLLEENVLETTNPKTYILGGEALTHKHIKKLNKNNGCKIINEYGPTEVTVGCITHLIEEDEIPYIGKPICNTQVFLLNEKLELVPYGAVGEIYIAGNSVGQGYLGMEEVTTSRFVTNPFGEGFLYKTGDIARWAHNGKLLFLGRNDNQVKINGFRVEIDEIINTAEINPRVETFYVLINKDNNDISRLFGYYKGSIKESELFDYLSAKLPDYMIPSVIQKVESFELTVNGKIDKDKLTRVKNEKAYSDKKPLSNHEELLKKVWAEVLMIDEGKLNSGSNFINLGGDSIKAIRLVVRMRQVGYKLNLKNILSSQDLHSMAKEMENNASSIPAEESLQGAFKFSPIQHLFFSDEFIKGSLKEKDFYNQSRILKFNKNLSALTVKQAIKKLITHHDALRLKFDLTEINTQSFEDVNQIHFHFHEFQPKLQLTEELLSFVRNHGIAEVKQQINIKSGVLLSAGLYQGHNCSCLLISIHHLAVDHISWEFIIEDLISLIEGGVKELPHKTLSYKKYCEYFAGLKNNPAEEEATNFWQKIDREREINLRRKNLIKGTFADYKTQIVHFSAEHSTAIMSAITNSANIDIQVLCLSSLTESLGVIFGQGKYRFHLEGHGRDIDDVIDVSRTVGWFTSITPILSEKKSESGGLQEMLRLRDEIKRQKIFLNFYSLLLHSVGADNIWTSKSWVEFNFLGSSSSSNDNSIVTDETGNESSLSLINMADLICVGEWRNGELNFRFTFEKHILTETEINHIISTFKKEMVRLAHLITEKTDQLVESKSFNYAWIDHETKLLIQNQFGEIENISKLTPLQLGMYFLHSSSSNTKAYHWQYGCELLGELEVKKYKESFGELINRHGILKSIIRDDIAAEPLQIQLKTAKPDFRFMDISLNDEDYNEALIKKLIQEDLDESFDLSEKPAIRLTLVKLKENHYYRLWSNHHIILDGWSTGLVLDELDEIYACKLSGKMFFKNIDVGFSDYLTWLDSCDIKQSKSYWNEYLKGIKNVAAINANKITNGANIHKDFNFNIPNGTIQKLKELLAQNQITLNVAVHFLWALILSKHSNEHDVVFGSVVSGRPPEIDGIDQAVGMFINAIPVRIIFNDTKTVLEQLKYFQNSFYESASHHYINLGDIISATIPGKSLINNILTFEKETDAITLAEKNTEIPYEIKNEYVFESTNYNLNFIVKPIDGLSFTVKYNFDTYSDSLIKKLSSDWNTVIHNLIDKPNIFLDEIVLNTDLLNSLASEQSVLSPASESVYIDKVVNDSYKHNIIEDQKHASTERLKELYADVLGIDVNLVEINKGFFEMGGHSVNAIKLLSKLRKEFSLKINYSSFARLNRIIDLADLLGESATNDMPEMIKIEESDVYEVSPSQRRMWLLNQLGNSGNSYNVYWGYRIHGPFQKKTFEKAISKLIERHEILRTIYTQDNNGELKQVVLSHTSSIFNISHHSEFQTEKEKCLFVEEIIAKSFDLKTGPVIKNYILDCVNTIEWYIVLHHIVTDDQTFVILIKEISKLYNEMVNGNDNALQHLEFQYKDYATWFNKLNTDGFFKREIDYWKKKLGGKTTSLNIPNEVLRPITYLNVGKNLVIELDRQVINKLRILAKDKNITLFTVLLTYLKIVLKAYSNQETITIGTPLSGRILSQLEGQMGYYLNAVPILTDIEDNDQIDTLLNKVGSNISEAYTHGNISFDDLINQLNLPRDMSRNPIFDVWADYHHSTEGCGRGLNFQDCSIEEIIEEIPDRPTKFDLTFVFIDNGENVDLHFEYNTSIYSEEIARNIVTSYLHVLSEYHSRTMERIENINCISETQMDLMNQIFRSNDVFKSTGTIVDLFHEVVDNCKDKIAVSTKKLSLTYTELNEFSNSLAELLRKKHNVTKGDWIAISLPRNEMVLVAIWAIIKLGAAYVPLEIELPVERKKFIINDVQAKLVVDEDMIEEFFLMRNLYSSSDFSVEINGDDFVYCMYTSGSTGTPKAVKISHDNLYSSNIARQVYYGNKGLRSFALYSYSFDSSVNLFFDTLLTGGNLYIHDTPKLDLYQVSNEMNINKSEILTIPPSLYDLLLDNGSFIHLKKVIVAGEECLSSLVRKHFKVNPNVELYNEYGPTECTVWSLVHNISKVDEDKKRIPIGLPIPFVNILILNKKNRRVPAGALGELFIAGPGVAEHYKGNFISTEQDYAELNKYYKTGDLVRINSDFQVEYVSRVDSQLKIRGYRVETGEIENLMKSIAGVSMAHVTHMKDADNQTILIAYYSGDIKVSDLKIRLQQKVQDYMVPTFIKKIDTLPLTLNGKIDESSLPKKISDLIEKGSVTIEKNTLAYELSEIWSEAMMIDRQLIYIDSDFFSLGGNSLKAIKLIHLIVKKYQLQMQLNTLFTNSKFSEFLQVFQLMLKSNTNPKGEFHVEI